MAASFEQVPQKANYDLPASFTREIGRIVVRWAFAENYAQGIIYMLVNVTNATGRMAIQEPRFGDRIALISDLANHFDLKIDQTLAKEIISDANTIKRSRDMYAHSAWTYSKAAKCWAVLNTRGKWDQEAAKLGLEGSKKIRPEGVPTTLDDLKKTTAQMDILIEKLRALQAPLERQIRERNEQRNEQYAENLLRALAGESE